MTDIHNYLNDMLTAARSKSGDAMLTFTVEHVLRNVGPRQAEVLRRCAVPRWFDASVLRVLREKDTDNDKVLNYLREYSFVRELGDGRLAYHDDVRQAFLLEWKRDRPDELRDLHQRLYLYFNQRTTPPGSLQRAMPLMAESTLISVVPIRAQADMWRREAIYHRLHSDPDGGLAELRTTFSQLQEAHRVAEAEQLLQIASEAPLTLLAKRWVHYMRARILQAGLNLEAAEQQLLALQAYPDLTDDLAAETNRSLGAVYMELGQWARATALYRSSLAYFRARQDRRAMAETMLLLGEAYQGMGISTGSWYVAAPAPTSLLQTIFVFWIWLVGLPFWLVATILGPGNRLLPIPDYCARYQNWLLIRLYNAARGWYAQARDAFHGLGDETGTLRAEQRLADIVQLYGYAHEAKTTLHELLKRPPARDPYRKAWLQRSLAECHLATGDIGTAQVLLSEALTVFSEIGDLRREATIRSLQGRAAMLAGDSAGAFDNYERGLERFRALRYAAARERILHELRTWERQPAVSAQVCARIATIIAAEPEKRYVGRFIRSALPTLQIVTILAFPLTMLLLAMFVPTAGQQLSLDAIITLNVIFDPFRFFGVFAALLPIYLAVYAALATLVIYLLPLSQIEREQPDVIITTPTKIARYDRLGNLEIAQEWSTIRRWIALDRCVWDRPLALYSRTYLEDEQGRDLPIDGITGWYAAVQTDIAQRLANANMQVERRDLGYTLLRSRQGVLALIGALLLLFVGLNENGWLPFNRLLPPALYAAISFTALSGLFLLIPLAYWIANRPLKLQRALLLNDRWPLFIGGFGALPILLHLISGGQALSVQPLNHSTFVWGVYVVTEALIAGWSTQRRRWRVPVLIITTLLALSYVALPAYGSYQWQIAYTAKGQALGSSLPDTSQQARDAAIMARELGADPFTTLLFEGDGYAAEGNWSAAANSYAQAAAIAARSNSSNQIWALFNQYQSALRANDRTQAADVAEQLRLICPPVTLPGSICAQFAEDSGQRTPAPPAPAPNDDDDDD
jgi:tetratricopeptide (TPR) repeat protein